MDLMTIVKSPLEATKNNADWKRRLDMIEVSGKEYSARIGYTYEAEPTYRTMADMIETGRACGVQYFATIERMEITGNPIAFFVDWNTESLMSYIENDLQETSCALAA